MIAPGKPPPKAYPESQVRLEFERAMAKVNAVSSSSPGDPHGSMHGKGTGRGRGGGRSGRSGSSGGGANAKSSQSYKPVGKQ